MTTHPINPRTRRHALGIACALAVTATAGAADAPLRIHGTVALHEHDTLVVFARGPAGWDAGFAVQMGTLDGLQDITDQCVAADATAGRVDLHCHFDDGLPANGEYLVQLFAGNGQAGEPFSLAIGRRGDIGPPGVQGDVGAAGAVGAQGDTGDAGARGTTGARGEQGQTGDAGAIGPQGPTGGQGPHGNQGATGARGPAGPQGAPGAAGAQGPAGPVGPQGPQGMPGATGPVGPMGPTGHAAAVPLVTRESLPQGDSDCPFGGQLVRSGSDANNDGILDPGEVQNIGLVCNDSRWTQPRVFSTCAASGRFGPEPAACATAYAGTPLVDETSVAGGIQEWVVPFTGTYRITAQGAQGGYMGGVVNGSGPGARVSAEFELQGGDVLRLLVGQSGFPGSYAGETGGGGGTFVAIGTTPLLVAGGGGSAGGCGASTMDVAWGRPASLDPSGSAGKTSGSTAGGMGGSDGAGGAAVSNSYPGGGGGGFLGSGGYGERFWDGCSASITPGMTGLDADARRTAGGQGFLDGGVGGRGCYAPVEGQGGFGGGGGAGGCGGAGGGGYSGGGGGSSDNSGGGGGGSFVSGDNAEIGIAERAGHGQVTIDLVF